MLKNRIISGLGSSLEWFDFALYGFFGPIFSQIFFQKSIQHKWIALMMTYAIFAAGFCARPIGALIFGYLGDKYGRIVPLRITPLLITCATLVFAIIPPYLKIGNAAIFILLGTRIVQGIFLGGEFSGNIVYLCESSSTWRYFWGSIGSCTGSFGIILASIIASIFYTTFSHDFMYAYGWRIAYLISLPLGIIVFMMRLKISESPEFFKANIKINPILTSIKNYKKKLFLSLGLIYLHATSFYFVFIFIPIFLMKVRHLPESAALFKNSLFLALHLLFIPIFGALVNIFGGLKSTVIISLIFLSTIMPIFCFIAYGGENEIFISLCILSIITACNAAIIPGLLSNIIPAKIRYTMIALSFNIGFGIFGGTVPFFCLFLIKKSRNVASPAIYLSFASLVTLVIGYYLLKTSKDYGIRKV